MSDPAPTQLFLARHGQSIWNADGRWQGQADPPLSELGASQAADAIVVLTRRGSPFPAVDRVWASPLQRAHRTASIIAGGLGLDVATDLRLQEVDAGEWSGKTRPEIEADWPGYLAEQKRPPGFESHESLAARALAALSDISAAAPGRVVLVVTHGGVIGAVERHLGAPWVRSPNLGGREVLAGPAGLELRDRFLLLDPDDVEVTTPKQV
jgi:broad specificity phosphatase PhoE